MNNLAPKFIIGLSASMFGWHFHAFLSKLYNFDNTKGMEFVAPMFILWTLYFILVIVLCIKSK